MKQETDVGRTYTQIATSNRDVGLFLFQLEEGILLSSFLFDGDVEFTDRAGTDGE